MRRLIRTALTKRTNNLLTRSTTAVTNAPCPKTKAEDKWKRKAKLAFTEIRGTLDRMASGRSRCMYCEDSMGTDIDHFWPKATYPLKAFTWNNYLLACSYCNSNLKRQDFPLDGTGLPLLIDPTTDDPTLHLIFLPSTGEYHHKDLKGETTIRVFALNDKDFPRQLPKGRRDALISLVALFKEYDATHATDPDKASEVKEAAVSFPFNSILHWIVGASALPGGGAVLGHDVVQLVARHNINTWLTN